MSNTEILLTKLYEVVSFLDNTEQAKFNKYLSTHTKPFDVSTALACVIDECKEMLRKEQATKSGKSSAKKAAEAIFKECAIINKPFGSFVNKDGFQIIGGSHTVVRLKEHLPVVEFPSGLQPLDYDKLICDLSADKGEVFELPSITELKSYIKDEKSKTESRTQEGY